VVPPAVMRETFSAHRQPFLWGRHQPSGADAEATPDRPATHAAGV